jgi:hypothetical protein
MRLSKRTLNIKRENLKRHEPDLCDSDEEEGRRAAKDLQKSEEDEEDKEFYKHVLHTS